jgi:exodeoxyribonuclease V alpha subunit
VLRGEVRRSSEPDPATGRRAWYVADQFSDQGAAGRFVVDLFENVLMEKLGFGLIQDVMLLTPTHKGPLGTIELNIALQRLVQKKLWGVDVPPPPPGRRARLLPHDKVIQTRNNYKLEVMNGAVGAVDRIEKDGGLSVSFEERNVYIQPGSPDLRDLELAYALTVHKVQGSEFPCVVAIIHKAHSFQHHRNLLYTAVTRARKTVILVGDAWGLRTCAKKRQVDERRTFLPFFLSGAVPLSKT